MTIREASSYTIRIEILFWDILIHIMTTMSKLRKRINNAIPFKFTMDKNVLAFLVGLVWLFLGLYIGFLLGFLGI